MVAPTDQDSSGYDTPAPAHVAEKLNRRFPFDLRTGQYFTMLYGVLNVETRQFRYVSAGNAGPAYATREGKPVDLTASSFPIGLLSHAEYEERLLELEARGLVW